MRRGPVDSGYVGELFPFVVEGKHGSEDGGIYRESLEFVLGYAHPGENLQACLEALECANGENRRWQEEIVKRHLVPAKKPKCLGTPDESIACKECALNKFWKWRPCALQGVETPTAKPAKDPIAVLLDGKWYSDGKEISEVEARTGAPCDQEHACVIVADPKGKAYDSRYPCRCFHCKGNQGPCGSKCGLYPEGTTGGKHGGCCMVQHEAKSRAEVELGVT